jgi:uncharacterized protein YxjI
MAIFGSTSSSSANLELKSPTDLTQTMALGSQIVIKQKRELTEVFLGFETRNQYLLFDQNGAPCGSVVEQGSGISALLKRWFLKSHRPFVIDVIDATGKVILQLSRPFFFFFSDIEVRVPNGPSLGTAHRRFGILNKIYDLKDNNGRDFAQIRSSVFKIWTFSVRDAAGNEVARISKKWSGALKEYFTDSDNFMIEFGTKQWTAAQRAVIFATAISVDFDFFENNNSN